MLGTNLELVLQETPVGPFSLDRLLAAMGDRAAPAPQPVLWPEGIGIGCHGTSFRQHNGPGADQEVWHYHLHAIPRFVGDRFYVRTDERYDTTLAQRQPFVAMLRERVAVADASSDRQVTNDEPGFQSY
jgi:hypothetical protein